MNNLILINFYIVRDCKYIECYLSKDFSLCDNFKLLNKMLEETIFTNGNIFIDDITKEILNPQIEFSKLNIYQGMTINVY